MVSFFFRAARDAREDPFYPHSRWEKSWAGCFWFVLRNWRWLRGPTGPYSNMTVGSKVLCRLDWAFGVKQGYHAIPGEIITIGDGGFSVRWHDGHISFASPDELILA